MGTNESAPNELLVPRVGTPRSWRKRWLASLAILLSIALPVSGLVMVAVDRVQDASDRAT